MLPFPYIALKIEVRIARTVNSSTSKIKPCIPPKKRKANIRDVNLYMLSINDKKEISLK